MGTALLAMLDNRFPVFLIPSPRGYDEIVNGEQRRFSVRIFRDQAGWYLRDPRSQVNLFSFDLPKAMFQRYEERGMLTPEGAINLKREQLSRFQAFWLVDGQLELIHFELDRGWLEQVMQGMAGS